MAIKLIIDSASDILPGEAEKLGLIHLPHTVTFGKTEYRDSVDLSHREFYEKLIESDELPTTSQISPGAYAEAMEKVISSGDTPLVITLTGELSGTYQSACIAKEEFGDKVTVIDSRSVCVGERLLILRALELIGQGKDVEEIAHILNNEKNNIRVLALLDTLEYLKKGGRISSAAAIAGGILSIKPVITLSDGKIELIGKARGSKKGNNLLRQMVADCGGIDFDMPYALAYSGLSDEMLQKYIEDSGEIWKEHTHTLPVSTIGCAIGTHAGPGAVAVAFFEKKARK